MLAATYAKRIGRTVAFALAAFRQAFAAGRDLAVEDNVLIAAAACEIHPTALLKAIGSRGVRDELDRATASALELGVIDVPAVRVGDLVLVGDARLEEAGRLLAGSGSLGRVPPMTARQAYRLIVTRGGRMPSFLADPARVDHIEVVEIDSGEVVLYWDCEPGQATRMARALRRDLAQLEDAAFISLWSRYEGD